MIDPARSRRGRSNRRRGNELGLDAERFWAKVRLDDDGCWRYEGPYGRGGYGLFHAMGRGKIRAHRVAFFLANGRWPRPGMDICHRCDNPPCVRPDHLWEGTRAENNADMRAKGRHHGVKSPVGEAHPLAKITWPEAAAIRAAHDSGESLHSIARRYPISRQRIREIVRGSAWKTE